MGRQQLLRCAAVAALALCSAVRGASVQWSDVAVSPAGARFRNVAVAAGTMGETVGLAVADAGLVYRLELAGHSGDRGASPAWKMVLDSPWYNVTGVSFLNASHALLAGVQNTPDGESAYVRWSTDTGATWSDLVTIGTGPVGIGGKDVRLLDGGAAFMTTVGGVSAWWTTDVLSNAWQRIFPNGNHTVGSSSAIIEGPALVVAGDRVCKASVALGEVGESSTGPTFECGPRRVDEWGGVATGGVACPGHRDGNCVVGGTVTPEGQPTGGFLAAVGPLSAAAATNFSVLPVQDVWTLRGSDSVASTPSKCPVVVAATGYAMENRGGVDGGGQLVMTFDCGRTWEVGAASDSGAFHACGGQWVDQRLEVHCVGDGVAKRGLEAQLTA